MTLDTRKDILLILAVSILVSFAGMWKIPVSRNQEARIAVSAREILQNGHWLIPTFNDRIRVQKPPLMTWIVALSYRGFGRINEFSLRVPSYLFSLAAGLLIYGFGCRLFGRYAGLISAMVLMTSFEFIRHSRLAEIDMALLLTIVAGLACWYRALLSKSRNSAWIPAGYLCCAIAVNLKGPVGILVPFTVFLGYLLATRQYAGLKRWLNPWGILGCIILSAAWYGFAFFRESQAAAIFKQEVNVTFIQGSDHPGPVYYYLYTLLRTFAPWTIFAYGAVILGLWVQAKNRAELFILLWAGIVLIMLSLNPNKQPHYALLLSPPMALLAGRLADRLRPRFRWSHVVVIVLVGLVSIGTLLDTFFLHARTTPKSQYARQMAQAINQKIPETAPIYSLGFSAGAIAFHAGRSIPIINPDDLALKTKAGCPFFVIVEDTENPVLKQAETVIPALAPKYPYAVKKILRVDIAY